MKTFISQHMKDWDNWWAFHMDKRRRVSHSSSSHWLKIRRRRKKILKKILNTLMIHNQFFFFLSLYIRETELIQSVTLLSSTEDQKDVCVWCLLHSLYWWWELRETHTGKREHTLTLSHTPIHKLVWFRFFFNGDDDGDDDNDWGSKSWVNLKIVCEKYTFSIIIFELKIKFRVKERGFLVALSL